MTHRLQSPAVDTESSQCHHIHRQHDLMKGNNKPVLSLCIIASLFCFAHQSFAANDDELLKETNKLGRIDWDRSLSLPVSTDGLEDSQDICTVIQNAFEANVKCDCFGSLGEFLSISCEYIEPICGINKTCGRPLLTVSIVEGKVFSSTTCIRDYRQGMKTLEDTCVSVSTCENSDQGLCECFATYKSDICRKCEICNDGKGVSFDCTNVNLQAVASTCTSIDMDLDLYGSSNQVIGFIPEMSGFCSAIEQGLDNRITCDCTNAIGGTFSITCKTNDDKGVQSTVAVVDGQVDSVTACTDNDAPFGRVCTALQFCESTPEQVCACVATYDGATCQSCEGCQGGRGVKLDCSNRFPDAVVSECQQVDKMSSYEFKPNFTSPGQAEQSGSFGVRSIATLSITCVCVLIIAGVTRL